MQKLWYDKTVLMDNTLKIQKNIEDASLVAQFETLRDSFGVTSSGKANNDGLNKYWQGPAFDGHIATFNDFVNNLKDLWKEIENVNKPVFRFISRITTLDGDFSKVVDSLKVMSLNISFNQETNLTASSLDDKCKIANDYKNYASSDQTYLEGSCTRIDEAINLLSNAENNIKTYFTFQTGTKARIKIINEYIPRLKTVKKVLNKVKDVINDKADIDSIATEIVSLYGNGGDEAAKNESTINQRFDNIVKKVSTANNRFKGITEVKADTTVVENSDNVLTLDYPNMYDILADFNKISLKLYQAENYIRNITQEIPNVPNYKKAISEYILPAINDIRYLVAEKYDSLKVCLRNVQEYFYYEEEKYCEKKNYKSKVGNLAEFNNDNMISELYLYDFMPGMIEAVNKAKEKGEKVSGYTADEWRVYAEYYIRNEARSRGVDVEDLLYDDNGNAISMQEKINAVQSCLQNDYAILASTEGTEDNMVIEGNAQVISASDTYDTTTVSVGGQSVTVSSSVPSNVWTATQSALSGVGTDSSMGDTTEYLTGVVKVDDGKGNYAVSINELDKLPEDYAKYIDNYYFIQEMKAKYGTRYKESSNKLSKFGSMFESFMKKEPDMTEEQKQQEGWYNHQSVSLNKREQYNQKMVHTINITKEDGTTDTFVITYTHEGWPTIRTQSDYLEYKAKNDALGGTLTPIPVGYSEAGGTIMAYVGNGQVSYSNVNSGVMGQFSTYQDAANNTNPIADSFDV